MKGWYGNRFEHSLASRGIRSRGVKNICSKPLPVYKGYLINDENPIDLRELGTAGSWSLDSRVAKLFSANPKNSRLEDGAVVNAIMREYDRLIEKFEIDPTTNPKWLERWLDDVSNWAVNRLDVDEYGIVLRSNITRGDKIKREGINKFLLEQEAYSSNPLEVLEIGYVDQEHEEPLWINYNDVPDNVLEDSNKFRDFIYKKGEERETEDRIPTGIYMSFIHENFDVVIPEQEEIIKQSYYDLQVDGHDFWDLYCDILPKYDEKGKEFNERYERYKRGGKY